MEKILTAAVVKIIASKAPTSGEIRGYRVKIAHANRDGSAFGNPVPAFTKKYLITESGDYPESDPRLQRFIDRAVERFSLKLVSFD